MRAFVLAFSLLAVSPIGSAIAQESQPGDAGRPAEPAKPSETAKPAVTAKPAPGKPEATNDDVRISGVVERFQNGLISISPSQGVTLTVRFDAGPGINSMRKGKPADLKTGAPVTAQATSNPAGGMMAAQVILYEQGAESSAGTQASTDPKQVVARIADIGSTPDGVQLTLTYNDGERKITLAKDAVIWIARPASADDIKVGSLITISGRKPPDSEIKVIKASIGPSGAENPPL